METWRFIDSTRMSAAENMAIDRVLLTSRSMNWAPDTFLFLEFTPCVLVGYHQSIELEVEEAYCRKHGVQINRRITGGGAIYMDEGTLGWAIFAGKNTPGIPSGLDEMYASMCNSVVRGLSRLGVNAKFRPKNDIEVNGRKVSGSGGTEMDGAFLYHGSLLIDFNTDTMINCLKLPIKKLEDKNIQSFRERVTCLREVLGYVPDLQVVKDALLHGFREVFSISFETGTLTDKEKSLFEQEILRFRSEEWIRGKRSPNQSSELRVSDYKAPGGVIRASILLDRKRNIIKSVFITGDFFAYPKRCILDLEAFLRNSSSLPSDVRANIRRFFISHNVQIPGVEADHFGEAVVRAITDISEQDGKVPAITILEGEP